MFNVDWNKVNVYLDDFTAGGWRKLFFWSSVGTMAVALPLVYVIHPIVHMYAPPEYLDRLNVTLGIIGSMAGLRAIEKHVARTSGGNSVAGTEA